MTTATKKKPEKSQPVLIELIESITGGDVRVDREAGIIYGVKVQGKHSRNKGGKREYTDNAMRESRELCEGAKVNIDHPPKQMQDKVRGFAEGFGELRNNHKNGDENYADMHFLKSHPMADMVCESAERFPNQFGLSINAYGKEVERGGKYIVESVNQINSVDLVCNPATNRGLFESCDPEEKPVQTTLKEFIEAIDETHADRAFLTAILEMDGVSPAMGDMPMDMPAEGMSADDQAKDAFKAMINAVVDEGGDVSAMSKRIKQILQAQDKLMHTETPETETPAEETPALESAQKARLDSATELLEAAGIKAQPWQVKTLSLLTESVERKALIASWKPVAPVLDKARKPAFSRPLVESTDAVVPMLKGESLLAALKR